MAHPILLAASLHVVAAQTWPITTLGNHRYKFTVPAASTFLVELPWRRTGNDRRPAAVTMFVTDAFGRQ